MLRRVGQALVVALLFCGAATSAEAQSAGERAQAREIYERIVSFDS